MGQVSAFVSRMTRRNSILLIGVAAALLAVMAMISLMNRDKPAQAPSAAADPDVQTAPATGAPPEAGGQTDIIPPDEGGDDQGSADQGSADQGSSGTDVEAPPP